MSGSDKTDQDLLHERGLAFFGAITASVSHELNNVISIIDQNAGLMEDLLAGSRAGRAVPEEKLERIAATVQEQTQRGLTIIRRLNSFAHSVDQAQIEFDLVKTISNLSALCTRLASLKKVHLEFDSTHASLPITGSPFLVQQLLFLVISCMLAESAKDDSIRISVGRDEKRTSVSIRGGALSEESRLRECINDDTLRQRLGAEIRLEQDAAETEVVLVLPMK